MNALLTFSALVLMLSAHLSALAAGPGSEAKPPPDPQAHWAFKAPVRPKIPAIAASQLSISNSPSTNPVDAFVAAEREKRGLRPAPAAPKAILLRRVYLDLIGLPPTREELRAFLEDDSPDAYEKTVDRLLASPQHAERWARHWMDIWRYADWYGRRHVPDVWNSAPQVWRWRNWIVRSLQADKGYDRMIVEMLAADEVAPEDDDARVATGYLIRNWYALNANQWMRDIVEHTGKAFLGLTFNCAHCHDHKYDPITQRDYFQFRAFFEPLQVRQDWVKGEPDPGPFQKYEYSALRKVVTNGMVSVFDENLQAKTFIYLRGDERSFPDGKPTVEPAMPAFLRGHSADPQRVNLPASSSYPGLKPFIREAAIHKCDVALADAQGKVAAAQKALTDARNRCITTDATNSLVSRATAFTDLLTAEVGLRLKSNQLAGAQAERDALHARMAADDAKYSRSAPSRTAAAPEKSTNQKSESNTDPQALPSAAVNELAMAASRAERLVALRQAATKLVQAEDSLALLQAEQAVGRTRRTVEGANENKADKDKAEVALKNYQTQVASARERFETAQAALKTNSTVYPSLSPSYPTQSTGRRRALAACLTSRANPLTARVAVNHIWARHFHTPLVASVFDFGRNGARPTHPELLDWLAVELMEHNWSMKHLHRLIVTSSAYRQSSVAKAELHSLAASQENDSSVQRSNANASIDPENRYLWRMNGGQMEAEVVRDSILFLADQLDLTSVGYPLSNLDAEKSHHRSLYFECFPEPNGQSQFTETFDAPNPTECYRRTQTIVPQQALALSNSKLTTDCSHALAERLVKKLQPSTEGDETMFVEAAYEQILNRRPTVEELEACRAFVMKQTKMKTTESARAGFIHALFNHNDFVTIR